MKARLLDALYIGLLMIPWLVLEALSYAVQGVLWIKNKLEEPGERWL